MRNEPPKTLWLIVDWVPTAIVVNEDVTARMLVAVKRNTLAFASLARLKNWQP
jgi:hypothetical protein